MVNLHCKHSHLCNVLYICSNALSYIQRFEWWRKLFAQLVMKPVIRYHPPPRGTPPKMIWPVIILFYSGINLYLIVISNLLYYFFNVLQISSVFIFIFIVIYYFESWCRHVGYVLVEFFLIIIVVLGRITWKVTLL